MGDVLTGTAIPIGAAIYPQDSALQVADAANIAHIRATVGIALISIPKGTALEKRVDGYYLNGKRVIVAFPERIEEET
jgi:hypothetical protein